MHSIKKDFTSLFILLCCCLIAWWPLTFDIFSLKNDALNYHLAIRYQISETISNGYLPFWTPYLNFGYPLHGDMQSGIWNPIVQIISLFGPYTLKTLQHEFLFYIYLSGAGMFFLLKYFFENRVICLLAAVAYMLSGYITDSAQFLNWISAASLLPFVFLFYYRTIAERNWKTALFCGFFYFLFFTSAYPADFILTSYLLLFVLIWYLFAKENRSRKIVWQQIKLNALIGISFLLLSLPAIISYAEFLPLTERGSGATYEQAMNNYLHPALLFSFLTPLPAWKASFASVTDPLERNCFLGLITFALLLTAFFIKSNHRLQRFLKWAFILSLIFSFGPLGGLRVAGYYLLPLMNTFRHPANARLFCIFFGCFLAAFSLEQLIKEGNKIQIRKYVWIGLLTCFAGLLIWSLTGPISIFSNHSFKKDAVGIKSFLDSLSFSDLLFINIILQIPFLAVLYFCFVKKIKLNWLLIASLINSIIHTALYQPFSAIKKDRVSTIQNILNRVQQKGYPIPDLRSSLAKNSENGDKYFDEIGSYNMYSKKIGRVDYKFIPSNFLTQNEFWQNKKLRDILFEYPFFYKADTIVKMEDSSRIEPTHKKIALIKNVQEKNFLNTDSSGYNVVIKGFTPLGWQINIQNSEPAFYCIFQNYYPRWQLFIDGKKQSIEQCNISFMGFSLPSGYHSVFFRYKIVDLKIAYLISCCTLMIMLALLLIIKVKPNSGS